MAKKTWRVGLDDVFHTVELEHNGWSGKRTIRVDDQLIDQSRQFVDRGSEHPIEIAGHRGAVVIRYNGLAYSYDLVVDGRSMKTGRPVALKEGKALAPLPSWAWVFVGACGLIPIVSLGGALSAAIGGGGAAACAAIARNSSMGTGARVALCAGVTALCWVLFAVMIVGVAALRAGR